MSARPGRRKYTDEPTHTITALFLADAEQLLREDAAHHRFTLSAVQVELSREYRREEVRQRVLQRVMDKLADAA